MWSEITYFMRRRVILLTLRRSPFDQGVHLKGKLVRFLALHNRGDVPNYL